MARRLTASGSRSRYGGSRRQAPGGRRSSSALRRRNWRTWAIVGVVVFLALDAVLVGLALSSTRSHVDPGAPPTYDLPAATPAETSDATEPAQPVPAVAAAPRMLAAANETVAWRATPGDCGAELATIETTADGGATWQAFTTTDDDVRQLLQLNASSDTLVSLVGAAGDACAVGGFRSFTGGRFWEPSEADLASASYLDPADPTVIRTPGGPVTAPCESVHQVVSAAESAVLCDNQVFVFTNGAWQPREVPGALAISASAAGIAAAVFGSAGCAGVEIQSVTAAGVTPIGCLADETAPEAVTISQTDGTVWLWSGDRSYVSTDGGVSW
ncbi:hypothetical protein GCM10027416_25950 [Okibacterium endophyticum]